MDRGKGVGSGMRMETPPPPPPQGILFVCLAAGKGVVLPRGTVTSQGSQSKLGGTGSGNGTSVLHIVGARRKACKERQRSQHNFCRNETFLN